ncbi:hypothetical protein A3C26_04260 [Candidatus Daviesbacteria bacterium RIFCSPHIGHO2_02_FULL_39_12]|uniref:HEAT repeat domain-containing protein n=2 Tax=Candidatus Daviesiibacteriota TaxID=1752718 RepID=A0A1F5JD81_9BACT|nr:MAG: hypothetical protein A3C26_04260 [Candidatus Daviesbacteria bacterium RIFCSPHIGHO2_02_FULL_39_12]OGE71580.1 MAG: hypothetical protein A3H40_03880 [Candidatus Daviesbacteria bacterium RIFCSPLOWO2_02_FULL_38_15]
MNNEFLRANRVFFYSQTGDKFFRPVRVAAKRPSIESVSFNISSNATTEQLDEAFKLRLSRFIYDLSDPDAETRLEATNALVAIGEQAVVPLISCFDLTPRPGLSQFPEEVGDEYAQAILEFGEPATSHLLKALADGRFIIKFRSANTLGRTISDPNLMIPGLIGVLDDSPPHTSYATEAHDLIRESERAITRIWRISEIDLENQRKLLALSHHPNPFIREVPSKLLEMSR